MASFSISCCFGGTPSYRRSTAKEPHYKSQLRSHFAERLISLVLADHLDANYFFDLGSELVDLSNKLLEHVAAPRSSAHADYELLCLDLGASHHDFYDYVCVLEPVTGINGLVRRIFLRVERPSAYQLSLNPSLLLGLAPFACQPSKQSFPPIVGFRLKKQNRLAIIALLRHWAHWLRPRG